MAFRFFVDQNFPVNNHGMMKPKAAELLSPRVQRWHHGRQRFEASGLSAKDSCWQLHLPPVSDYMSCSCRLKYVSSCPWPGVFLLRFFHFQRPFLAPEVRSDVAGGA